MGKIVFGKIGARVTRLGEFSPIGRLFSLESYLKITKVGQIFWATFLPQQMFCINFDKKWVGQNFG
jgi:hypothetical protein